MSVAKKNPVPSDIDIAQAAALRPITELAAAYGFDPEHVVPYGRYKAKLSLDCLGSGERRQGAKYIDVTAITPTPLGEGKTTTTVGLCQGLGKLGAKAACAIRQPSLGPVFGIKGGAAGGGYSQVVPMEEFNLHLTGDIHAVQAAHNLAAAALDARIHHESRRGRAGIEALGIPYLDIDPGKAAWSRVLDINDRALRNVLTGLGGAEDGPLRQGSFDIAVASEIMAILALSTSLSDFRARAGRMVIAYDRSGRALTAEELGLAGAIGVLMKDAVLPNVMQTLEEQLAFVHAGPFANIAHGNSSVLADLCALEKCDYVVTESGFGSDMGFEKFCDIKCRASGLKPDAAVIVATVRALKTHGGGPKVQPGKPLASEYRQENLALLEKGLSNLQAHIGIVRRFGIPAVVAINAFPTDTEAELELVRKAALAEGAAGAAVSRHWELGGDGALELAKEVRKAAEMPNCFAPLYGTELPLKDKIAMIAAEIYGAAGVSYSKEAEADLKRYADSGLGTLPVCMAKTQYSLSHDPAQKGAPRGYVLPVERLRLSAGAGFVTALCGEINTMPGLSSKPAYLDMDIDPETGRIRGLF